MSVEKQRRNTRQRQQILTILRSCRDHPTAAEVHKRVKTELPRISLGTVYRNLELLDSTNQIQRLQTAGHEARFDGNPRHHYHVRCVHCDRMDDVMELPADLVAPYETLSGYRILGHVLEFIGICDTCDADLEVAK